jgi:hypothetical protein
VGMEGVGRAMRRWDVRMGLDIFVVLYGRE